MCKWGTTVPIPPLYLKKKKKTISWLLALRVKTSICLITLQPRADDFQPVLLGAQVAAGVTVEELGRGRGDGYPNDYKLFFPERPI